MNIPSNLKLADPQYKIVSNIHLLLGVDVTFQVLRGSVEELETSIHSSSEVQIFNLLFSQFLLHCLFIFIVHFYTPVNVYSTVLVIYQPQNT